VIAITIDPTADEKSSYSGTPSTRATPLRSGLRALWNPSVTRALRSATLAAESSHYHRSVKTVKTFFLASLLIATLAALSSAYLTA